MRTDFWVFLFLILITGAVAFVYWGTITPVPFAYDEADYMWAGTRGFSANFLDRPSQSLVEFVQKGRELAHDSSRRQGMSEYVRSLDDVTFYRHYHGPVYAYWLAAWHSFGAVKETTFRGSGLVLHAMLALGLFWLFRLAFPNLGSGAAFIAAVVYCMNRTTLVAASTITQHKPFELLTGLALFTVALWIQKGSPRLWLAACALLGIAFSTVEISVVLVGAVALAAILIHRRDGIKEIARLLGKGALAFLAAVLVIWPKGLLAGNSIKGFLYLAYIAVYRKTFSPITPRELWRFKIQTYPYEMVLLLAGLGVALLGYRWLTHRKETLPFLTYAVAFVAVTMLVTVPYTYYHCSLMMTLAVLTGVAYGEIQKRAGWLIRSGLVLAILASLVVLDTSYYRETEVSSTAPSMATDAIRYFRGSGTLASAYVPYTLVPTLHYYLPLLKTTGFDNDWSAARIAGGAALLRSNTTVLCPEKLCGQLEQLWSAGGANPAVILTEERISTMPETGEALWAYQIRSEQ